MEWDLKMPPWDFPELDQNACESNLSSVVGSSGALDCSVDLKLGDLGDLGLATTWREQSGASVVSVPPRLPAPTTAKRQRLLGGGGQNVSCLVDGCKNDLSNCREYHRRHKVCQEHSKTPIVLVGGQEQRFCQQCSRYAEIRTGRRKTIVQICRLLICYDLFVGFPLLLNWVKKKKKKKQKFHMLVEFDEVKRSCRKRLDGHNRRRRKPQMELTTSINLLNHHGTSFTSNPQTDLSWSAIGKRDEGTADTTHLPAVPFVDDVLQHPLQPFGGTLWRSFGEGKLLPFLPSNGTTESSGSKIVFSDGASPGLNSGSALSLLSSSAQKPAIGVGNMVSVDSIPMSQPLLSSLQFGDMSTAGFSCSGMEDEDLGTVLVSDGNRTEVHCYSMFHSGSEGLSDGSSQPSLPFKWQ